MSIGCFNICGERCSGTNYLRKLIFDNFELWYTNLPEGSSAGWKHFFGSAVNCEEIKKAKDWCLVLCIVRNPIDYLMSFWENPHHQILKRRKSIEAFLMDEFYSINEKGEIMEDRNINDPTKRYKDIFEMRATKLRWMYCVLPTLTMCRSDGGCQDRCC